MKQKQCKKYVAPTMEEFPMDEAPIMTGSGTTEKMEGEKLDLSRRRSRSYYED